LVLRAYRGGGLVPIVAVVLVVLISVVVEAVGSGSAAEWGMVVVKA
jgi:hypothetical protein